MAKDLSRMILTAIVPTTRTHALDEFLEENGATEIMWRPYRPNGAAPAAPESTVQTSARQQAWLEKHVKGETTAKEIVTAWRAAGFAHHSCYGALSRAVESKILKKVRPGVYKPA